MACYCPQGTPTRHRGDRRHQLDREDSEFFGLAGRGGSALNEEEKRMIEAEDFDFEANLAMFDKVTRMTKKIVNALRKTGWMFGRINKLSQPRNLKFRCKNCLHWG